MNTTRTSETLSENVNDDFAGGFLAGTVYACGILMPIILAIVAAAL